MNSPEWWRRTRPRWSADVAVTSLFLALMISLAAGVAYYWFAVLAPQLDANARASATALANADAQAMADALTEADPAVARRRLVGVMDEILIAREPITGEPIFVGVRTEIDYDVVPAARGELDIDKRSGPCADCLQIDVPLYARTSRELLGIARFEANLQFLQALKQDVGNKLSGGAALLLVVIGGIWWAVGNLMRRLTRNERNLRAVFQAAPIPMVLVRQRDGVIVRANRAAAELFGMPLDDLAGLAGNAFHVSGESSLPLCGPAAGRTGVDGREIEVEDRRGQRHWALVSSHPIDYFNEPAHILSYADVSALKHVQRELTVAKEAAEAATRAKSQFVANMSHEIRTPLNAVTGFCLLAERTALDAKQRGYLNSIRKATELLLGIINNILDFSKLDAGKAVLERADFSLAELVSDLLDLFGVLADERSVILDARLADDVPELLRGDAHRLKQVLTNLLGNALKFTEQGRVQLNIAREARDDGALVLRFEIVDTGIGIAPEALGRLFESFSQADESITRKHGGTGLGLAICQSLVTLMGGEIGVRSTLGRGSTFWFTVPFARARQRALASRQVPDKVGLAARKGSRVLVVDDNRTNRRIMGELLGSIGLAVVEAQDGLEAVEAVAAAAFDLVLMDLQMPRMDGYEATARIRERFSETQLPIVAMTAHAGEEDRAQSLAAGMNGHLVKPIDPIALAELLARWLPMADDAGLSAGATVTPEPMIELPGVNVAAGLVLAGNKPALYRQLLRDFAQDHADSVTRLRAAIRAGDRQGAARIAHNLKGTAANLGARTLERHLEAFEREQRAGGDTGAALGDVDHALKALLGAIERMPQPDAPDRVAPGRDAGEIPSLIQALDHALADSNFDATQYLERLITALGGQPEDALADLSRAVLAFDFDAGRRALTALSGMLNSASGDRRDG